MSPSSLLALDRMHEDLDTLFLRHQEQLVLRDVPAAREALDRFARRLALHMRQEEAHLLPHYRGVVEGSSRERAGIYRLEHRKLDQLVSKLQAQLAGIPDVPAPRQVIHLLERGSLIKHVLEHHGARERTGLYAELDVLLPDEHRRAVIATCRAEWIAEDPATGT